MGELVELGAGVPNDQMVAEEFILGPLVPVKSGLPDGTGPSAMYVEKGPDFVVPAFAMVGVGTTLRRGVPGVAPIGDRRLQIFADLWLGYLWPQRSFGFDLQLGLGLPLPRAGELSLSGFLANSRHPGGADPLSGGAGLRYAY